MREEARCSSRPSPLAAARLEPNLCSPFRTGRAHVPCHAASAFLLGTMLAIRAPMGIRTGSGGLGRGDLFALLLYSDVSKGSFRRGRQGDLLFAFFFSSSGAATGSLIGASITDQHLALFSAQHMAAYPMVLGAVPRPRRWPGEPSGLAPLLVRVSHNTLSCRQNTMDISYRSTRRCRPHPSRVSAT